ncbi:MAG: Ig-like domain-containing protein [Candidatus Syntrophosphaera sp.]
MPRILDLFILLLSLALLVSCGSRKNPTGGPEDLEKPEVVSSLPQEFGQIANGRIELNFSKSLDKTTVPRGIYIHPPVAQKKITVDKSTVLIRFEEDLLDDTNYYVTLSTRLKDIRGNSLAENQTLVFAHGQLNESRLSGRIGYEDPSDGGQPVQTTLLSADSLVVLNRAVRGGSYALENLNPASYILRSYIDKNKNGLYDFSREPWFEDTVDVGKSASLDIFLAYADTTRPVVTTALPKSNREVVINFSEEIDSYDTVKILTPEDEELPILISLLREDKLTLLTPAQEDFSYFIRIRSLKDLKGNVTPLQKVEYRSEPELDTTPPEVTFSSPRNGTSVDTLEPVLEVRFSEIIPRSGISASLRAAQSTTEIPLDILQSDNDIYRFQARQPLQNYRSYVLSVSAEDISGNQMPETFELNFLPLLRSE